MRVLQKIARSRWKNLREATPRGCTCLGRAARHHADPGRQETTPPCASCPASRSAPCQVLGQQPSSGLPSRRGRRRSLTWLALLLASPQQLRHRRHLLLAARLAHVLASQSFLSHHPVQRTQTDCSAAYWRACASSTRRAPAPASLEVSCCESCSPPSCVSGSVTHHAPLDPSIKPAEERAAEARKEFELQAEQLLRCAASRVPDVASTDSAFCPGVRRTHVVESTDDMASYDFVPTERPWRDVLCVAAVRCVGGQTSRV
jgi:hypothetical protein